ncbi:MAG TPA: NAD(P)-binding protein [Polyangiaceae bacterium]|jgi:monoamine oxidase|nr:NAD(P)-binding protein [Polyangiaceae bacterium]
MAALAMRQPSRREFVAALLGAPAALAACRAAAPALPPGELLVPGKVAGHRLRDAPGDVPAPARFERVRVAIVGGGPSGLSAAWWLARQGERDLVVLELDEAVGGTSRSGESPLVQYPWGAHYIVAPLPHQASLVALLGELGALEAGAPEPTVSEEALCREPEERLFYRGRWYEGLYARSGASAADLAELERFRALIARWVAFRDGRGRRAFALPAQAASDDAEVTALDRESFATWLDRHGLRSARLRWLADYACRDDYGLLASDTSAWAGVSYFASRIRAPGDEPQPVVTWPEGNGRLVAHLARGLGPRLRLGHAVASVRNTESGVELVAAGPAGPVGWRAERAIMATPGLINRRVVAGIESGRAAPVVDRGAWAVANLHLDARPRARGDDAPLAWDNVFYDSPSLGYVVATHQRGRDHGPSVFTWYYPFTGDGAAARRTLDSATREDWAAAALADLARAHPEIGAACRRIDVAFWGHGMVRPRVGSVFDPALRAARAPLGRIHFAGSELSGLSLFEEALDHGVRAAEEVRAGLGHT